MTISSVRSDVEYFRTAERRSGALGPGLRWMVIFSEIAMIIGASIISDSSYRLFAHGYPGDILSSVGVGTAVSLVAVPMMKSRALYDKAMADPFHQQLKPLLLAWGSALLCLATLVFAVKAQNSISRGSTLLFAVLGGAALCFIRAVWTCIISRYPTRALLSKNAVLIAWQRDADLAYVRKSLTSAGFRLLKEIRIAAPDVPSCELELRRALGEVRGSGAEQVFLALPTRRSAKRLYRHVQVLPLPIWLVSEFWLSEFLPKPTHSFGSVTAIQLHRGPLSEGERFRKRAFDIVFSAFAIICLSPLLCLIALLIRLDTPGPSLFRQTRLGFNGAPFRIFKFRTMTVTEDGPTICQAARDDERVTRIGFFLRRTSLDELPQLINVLRGEMSIVGPRPHALAHDNFYADRIASYALRHHLKPGLTGWAQVNGYRGETPTIELMEKRVELDLWYIHHRTFLLDLWIIARTTGVLAGASNAY